MPDFKGKLELLNRGQRWVIRKISQKLPNITDLELRGFLTVMAKGPDLKIGALEEAPRTGLD